jgi:hypothetical protein
MRQTYILAMLGLIDLVTTTALVSRCGAAEANPLMAALLSRGLWVFVMVKITMLFGPLAVLEWSRRANPGFVAKAGSTAIAGYVVLYLAGVIRANIIPVPADLYEAQSPRVWQQIRQTIDWKRSAGLLPPPVYADSDRKDEDALRTGSASITRKQGPIIPDSEAPM